MAKQDSWLFGITKKITFQCVGINGRCGCLASNPCTLTAPAITERIVTRSGLHRARPCVELRARRIVPGTANRSVARPKGCQKHPLWSTSVLVGTYPQHAEMLGSCNQLVRRHAVVRICLFYDVSCSLSFRESASLRRTTEKTLAPISRMSRPGIALTGAPCWSLCHVLVVLASR